MNTIRSKRQFIKPLCSIRYATAVFCIAFLVWTPQELPAAASSYADTAAKAKPKKDSAPLTGKDFEGLTAGDVATKAKALLPGGSVIAHAAGLTVQQLVEQVKREHPGKKVQTIIMTDGFPGDESPMSSADCGTSSGSCPINTVKSAGSPLPQDIHQDLLAWLGPLLVVAGFTIVIAGGIGLIIWVAYTFYLMCKYATPPVPAPRPPTNAPPITLLGLKGGGGATKYDVLTDPTRSVTLKMDQDQISFWYERNCPMLDRIGNPYCFSLAFELLVSTNSANVCDGPWNSACTVTQWISRATMTNAFSGSITVTNASLITAAYTSGGLVACTTNDYSNPENNGLATITTPLQNSPITLMGNEKVAAFKIRWLVDGKPTTYP